LTLRTADLRLADADPAGQRCTYRSERVERAGLHVRRAAHYLERVTATRIDGAEAQAIRVRMLLRVHDACNDDVTQRSADIDHLVDRCAEHGEPVGDLLRRRRESRDH